MRNIIAYQGFSILHILGFGSRGESAVFVNGKKPDSEKANIKASHEIVGYEGLAANRVAPWHGLIKGRYFAKGFLENKDDNGNPMTFSYLTDGHNLAEGKQNLQDLLSDLCLALDADTSATLDKTKNHKLLYEVTIAVVIVLIVGIILFVLKK